MGAAVEELVREGMDRLAAFAEVPPGLAGRAYAAVPRRALGGQALDAWLAVPPAWAAGQWTESDAHGMQDNRRLTGTHLLSAEVVQRLPVAGVVRCVLQVGPRTGPAGDTTVIG
jgi:hypothetical protein